MIHKNEVVQFNEKHKWCGALGIVDEVHQDYLLIAIPHIHMDVVTTAYIRCRADEVELIGLAALVGSDTDE